MEEGFDKYGLVAAFSFKVQGNSQTAMGDVMKSLAGIEQHVKSLADSLKSSNVTSAFSSIAQQIKGSIGNIGNSLSVLDTGAKKSVNALTPLRDELRALKAEGKNINFGNDLKDVQAFNKGTQEIHQYIAALKALESQVTGNTAAEREFLASLKTQQAAAANKLGVAKAMRSPKPQTPQPIGRTLTPLRDEFKALKAESQNINLGALTDQAAFAQGEQAIKRYVDALKVLESQVTGNTAAEREFVASLKNQQAIALNKMTVAQQVRIPVVPNINKQLAPLKDEFKALRAESRNIDFGDFKDLGAFNKATQEVREYRDALKALETQVTGNTAAEREFVAALKSQQAIADNKANVAAASRDSARASERLGMAQGVKNVGQGVLDVVRKPMESAQEIQGQVANIKKLADDVSAKGLVDVQNAIFQLSAKTAIKSTDVGGIFEDLASSMSFADSELPKRIQEAEQIAKNSAALRITVDKATQLAITSGSIYQKSLAEGLPGFGSNQELNQRLGSSVNELADHLENVKIAASDVIPIMNVVMNTLGDAQNFRPPDIAAYAASVASLKTIDPKAAGSFFNRLSAAMSDKRYTGKFAETLGFDSIEEFGQALDTDKFGLIIQLVEKYKNLQGGELEKGSWMKERGIGSVQDQKLLQGLGSSFKVLGDSRKIANEGFEKGASVNTAFSKTSTTADFQTRKLKESTDSLSTSMGVSLSEAIMPLVSQLASFAEKTIQLAQAHPQLTKALIVSVAAFGAIATVAGTAGIALFGFQQAVASVKLASLGLSQIFNPITAQLSANTFSASNPLIGFFSLLKAKAAGIPASMGAIATSIRATGAAMMGFALSPVGLGIIAITGLLIATEKLAPQLGILGSVLGALGAPFAFVFGIAKGFFSTILSNLSKLSGGSLGAIAEPFGMFSNALQKALTILKSVSGSGEAVGSAIANSILIPLQTLMTLLNPLKAMIGSVFTVVAGGIQLAISGISGIVGAFSGAASLVSGLWNATIGGIVGRFQWLVDAASWIGQKLVSLLAENSPGPTFQIREKWQSTLEFLSGLFGWIADAANFAGNAISSAISLAVNIVNQGLATLNLFSFQPLVNIAAQAGGLIGGIFEATIGKVGGAIASVRSLGASVASVFTQPQKAVQNLGPTIASAGSGLLVSAGSAIQGAIAPVGTTAEASIQAPSAGIFDALATGLEWITEKFQAFQAILAQPLTLGFAGAISGTIDWFSTSFPTSIQGFVSGLTTITLAVTETLEPAFVTIKAVIEAAFAPLSAGVNMAMNLGNTIKSFIPGTKAQPTPAAIAPVNLKPIVSPIQQSSIVNPGDAIASSISAQTSATISQSRDVANAGLSTINAIKTSASNALTTTQNQLTTAYNSVDTTSAIAPSLEISSQIAASAEAPIVAEQSKLSSFFSNVMSRFDRTASNTLEASKSVTEKESLTSAIASSTQSLLSATLPPQPDISITFPNVKPVTADVLPVQTSLNSTLSSAVNFDNAVSSLAYSATVAGDRVNTFSKSSSSAIDGVNQLAQQTINAENSIANNSLSAQNNLGVTSAISQDLSTTAIAPITNLATQSQNFLSSIASTIGATISRNSIQSVAGGNVLNSSSQALNSSATALSNQALTQQSNSSNLASTVQSLGSNVANQSNSVSAIASSTNQISQQTTSQDTSSIENFRNTLERTFASSNQTQNLNAQIDSSTLENSFANSIARNTSGIQTSISQEARSPSVVNSIAVPAESHRIVTSTGIDRTLQAIANSSLETSTTDRASTLTQMPGLLRAKPSLTNPTTAIAPVLASVPNTTVNSPVALSVSSPSTIGMGGDNLNQVSNQVANSTQDSSLSFNSAIESATNAIASFRANLINQFNSQFGQENNVATSSGLAQNVANLTSSINTNLGATTANIGSDRAFNQIQTNSPVFGDTALTNALTTSQTSSSAAITESTTRAFAQLAQELSQNQATIANTISSSALNAPTINTANSLSTIAQSAIAGTMQTKLESPSTTNTTLSNNTNLLQGNSQVSEIIESATNAIATFRTQLINQFNNQSSQQDNKRIASEINQSLTALSNSVIANQSTIPGTVGDAIATVQNQSNLINSLTSSQASANTALAQNTTNAIAQLSQQSAQSQANISNTIAASSDTLATQTSNALSSSMVIAQTTNTTSTVAPVSTQIAEVNGINVASTIQNAGDAIASFRNQLIAQFNSQFNRTNAQTENLNSLRQDLTTANNSAIATQSQTAGNIANTIAASAQNKTDTSTTSSTSALANMLTSSQASASANVVKSAVDSSIKTRDNSSFVAGNVASSVTSTSENSLVDFGSTIQNAGNAIASFRSRLIERFSPATGTTGDRLASTTNNAANQNLNAIASNDITQNAGIESTITNAATAINTSASTQSKLVASVSSPTIQSIANTTQAGDTTQTGTEKTNIATSAIATVSQAFTGFFGGLFAKAEQVEQVAQKLKAPEYNPIAGEIQGPRFDVSSDVQKQYQQAKIDKASPQQLAVYEALLSVPDKLKSALPEDAQKLQQGQFSGLQQLNPKLAIVQAKSGIIGEQLSAPMPLQPLQQLSAPDTQAMQVRATVQTKIDAMNATKQPSLSDRPDKFLVGAAQQAEQQLRTKLGVIENLKTQLAETTVAGGDTFGIRYQLAQVEQSLTQVQLSPQTQTFLHTLGFSPAGIAATTNQVLSNVQNFGNEFQDRMKFYGNGGNLSEAIAPGVEQMQVGFNQLGGNVSTFSQEAFNSLKVLNFEGIKNSAVTFSGAAATSIGAIGAGFNSASLSAIAFGVFSVASLSPIPLIIGGIAAGVAIAATNFLGLRTIITSLVQTFYGVLDAALSVGIGIIQAVRGIFTAVGGIIPALTGDFTQLGAGVGMIFEGIQTGAGGLARGLGNVLGGAVGVVQGIFEGLGQVVRVEVLQGIINSVANFAGNIKGQIEGLADAIASAIKRPAEVWNNFFNRAKGGARQVQSNVVTPAPVEAPIASMQTAMQSAPQVATKQVAAMQQAIATPPTQPEAIAPLEQPTKKPGLLGSLFARRQNPTDVVAEQVQAVAEQPITLQAPASDLTEIAQQVNTKTQVIDSVKVNPTISQLPEQIAANQASPVVEAIAQQLPTQSGTIAPIQQPAKKAGFLSGLFRGNQASTDQGTPQALIQQTTTPQVPNQISTFSTQQTKTSLEQSTKKPGLLGGLFARKQKPVSVVTEQTQSTVEQQPIILQTSAPDVAEIAQQVNAKAQTIDPVKVNVVTPQLSEQIAVTQASPVVEAIAQQLPTQPEAIAPIQQPAKKPGFLGGLFRRGQQDAEQPTQQLQTIVQQTVAPQIPDQISADVTQQVKASVKSPAGETVLPTAATLPAPSVARAIATPVATTPPPLPSPVARTVGAALDVATGKAPDMLTARATRDFDMRLAGQEPEAQLTAGDRVQLASQKIETLISAQKPIASAIPKTVNPVFNSASALPGIDATEKKLIELKTVNQQAIASTQTAVNAVGSVIGSVAPQIAAPVYAVGDLIQGVGNLKEAVPNLGRSLVAVFPSLAGVGTAASATFTSIAAGGAGLSASLTTLGASVSTVFAGLSATIAPVLLPVLPVLGAIAASTAVLYLAFKNNFLGINDLVTGIGSSIKGFFSNLFGGAYEIVASVFVTIDQEMRGIFQTISSVGQDLIRPFAPLFKLFTGESFNAGSAIIKGLLMPLQLVASALSTLVKIVAGVVKGLIVAGSAIASVLLFPLTLVSNAIVGTVGAIQGLGGAIASVGSSVLSFLFSPFQQVWNIIQSIGSGLASLPIIGQIFGGFNTVSGSASQAPAVAANPSATPAPMQAFSKGGLVQSETGLATRPQPTQAFATGGLVTGPGTSTGDRVIAAVSPGEFVVNAEATRQNYGLIEAINSGQFTAPTQAFSQGGLVQPQIGDRVISAINYSSASLANSFGLASSPETGSSAIAVAPPRLPQMVDPPIALASNAAGISASSLAGDRPIEININFGDIVLSGNASSPEVADEFLDRISPQLERSLRDMLRNILEEGR